MTDKNEDRKQLWLYFVVAYAFSWSLWIPTALMANGVNLPPGLVSFLKSPFNLAAMGPFVAAMALTFFQKGGKGVLNLLKRGFDFRFPKIWLVPSLLLPLLIWGGAILFSILLGATKADFSLLKDPPYVIIGFFVIFFTSGPLQEEFGWRGYALPRLQSNFSALKSSIILGFFWWLWHLPAVFIPGVFMTDNILLFLGLSIVIVLASILFTWVYNNVGGSILAMMLLHTAMNWSIWSVMPDMKVNLSIIGLWIVFLAIAVAIILKIWGPARLSRAPQEV